MTYQSGSAISYYILDISDAERKAAELRSLYQGIRQDAASLSTPVVAPVSSGNAQAITASIQQQTLVTGAAQTATQALIATTIELGAAQGLTADQINAQLAAMSREAFAAGDLAVANELIDASLGKVVANEETLIAVRKTAIKTTEQLANEELRLAETQSRTLARSGDQVGALQLLTNARNNATGASKQAIATADLQIASLEKTSTASGALEGAIGSLVNPIVLFTAVAGTATAVVNSFNDALKLKANLDETTASIRILLAQTRDTSVVFHEAQQFADKYKLTQEETTNAISESIPIFRKSHESTQEILGTLERLSLVKPGKTFQDASRALSELASGNAVSLNRIFDIPLVDANRMKKEIQDGADAVTVLNTYLNDTGVTTRALEIRTEGLKGAYRDAAIEAEKLKLAQAQFGQGPGLTLTKLETGIISNTTTLVEHLGNLLKGDFQQSAQAAQKGIIGVTDSMQNANPIAAALGQFIAKVSGAQVAVAAASSHATIGILRSADADDRLAAASARATVYVEKLTAAQYAQNRADLINQRVGERSGGQFDNLDELTTFKDNQHKLAKEQYDDRQAAIQHAKDVTSAELGYAGATNNVAAQRRILNQQLKAAQGDEIATLNIKSQIAQLDAQQAKPKPVKGLSGLDRSEIKLAGDLQAQLDEVNHRLEATNLTQLQRNQLLIDQKKLQDQINDAVQKERDLQTNIALDKIHNAQKTNEENAELVGLQRAEKDSRFSAAQQVAIRLREQEILYEQQKRNNEITKEEYDLQKSIKDSGVGAAQVGQGAPIGATPVAQVPPIGNALPVTAQGIPRVALAGQATIINLTVNVDSNGKATAVQTNPAVALNLIGKALGVQVASGGFP